MNELRVQDRIAQDHPCLAGHFPGEPIVPGVVLLERVAAAVCGQASAAIRVLAIPSVKFLAALRPDEAYWIVWSVHGAQVRFRCLCGERLLAQGTLSLGADPVEARP